MKLNRNEMIKNHFDMVSALTTRLSEQGLSLFKHSYDHNCFGNWEMVIGSGHKERQFLWDGRDFFLIVSERTKTNSTLRTQWKSVHELPVGEVSDEELFEKVFQIASEI